MNRRRLLDSFAVFAYKRLSDLPGGAAAHPAPR